VKARILAEQGVSHKNLGVDKRVSLGKCPKCGGKVFEGTKNFYCENKKADNSGCLFSVWKEDRFWVQRKKSLTAAILKDILEKKKILVKGLTSEKTGKNYDAFVWIEEVDFNGKTYFNFKFELKKEK
jgi:DNA topoisomerase-3